MNTCIPAAQIKTGDVLIDDETDTEYKVLATSEDEIAWGGSCDSGGAFGQCFRNNAHSIFRNVTA